MSSMGISSSSPFQASVSEWLQQQAPHVNMFNKFFMQSKEVLHGRKYPEGSNDRVQKCLMSDRHLELLKRKKGTDSVAHVSEISENDRFDWLLKAVMECSRQALEDIPIHPGADPQPLTRTCFDDVLKRSKEPVFLYVYSDMCFHCHMQLEKKMCGARVFAPHVYTLDREVARSCLPREVDEKIEGTPTFLFYNNGSYFEIPLQVFQAVAERNF